MLVQESEIYAELTGIFHDIFMREDIVLRPDLTAREVSDWDSFKQVEIIIAIEDRYKFKFHTRELDQLANVGDLVRIIVAKGR